VRTKLNKKLPVTGFESRWTIGLQLLQHNEKSLDLKYFIVSEIPHYIRLKNYMRYGRISFISSIPPPLVDLLIKDYSQIIYNINIISVLNKKQIEEEMYNIPMYILCRYSSTQGLHHS
jgi:hypothetical protein